MKPSWNDLLEVRAGRLALERIRDGGIAPEDVGIVAGPATGPRWIVLAGIDRALADSRWLNRCGGVWLWGASAAAWRFAALAQNDPSSAIRSFQESYAGMEFDLPVDPLQVKTELARALSEVIPRSVEEKESLARGDHGPRLAVPVVRHRTGLEGMEKPVYLSAIILNFIHRSGSEVPLERIVFHASSGPPPSAAPGFPGRTFPLTGANLEKVLLATGSVPFKVEATRGIPGSPPGVYQDGGFLDYHVSSCLHPSMDDRLVLFITHPGRIMERWPDKLAPWRHPGAESLERLVVVRPSAKLLDILPGRRLPSRADWERAGRRPERLSMWKKALELCLPLGGIFMESLESGSIRRAAAPIE